MLSENGSIDETISQRGQKATGITSQINSMLNSITLGSYHYDIALVLRDALFVNSIMSNSEVWHNVQLKHTQAFEKSDQILLKSIVNAHAKTATEAFYLELAVLPLNYRLSVRRFMYLWHILHRDGDELIRKIYEAQKCLSVRGDWTELVEAEKAKYGISESDSEIAEMSREKFKSKIQKKIEAHAVRCLNNIAENHSKSEQIVDYDFKRKAYFTDRRFSKTDVQLLFTLRTKMLDCKTNFQNQYAEDLSCRFCKDNGNIEDEDHILRCTVLNNEKYDVKFSDVYGNIDQQYKAVQVYKTVMRRRKVYLEIIQKSS